MDFDRRVRLEFRGTQLSWDGGLPAMREPDDALGLSDIASGALCDARRGKNTIHRLVFRQSVYGRLAGYEDVNDADRPALDRVNRPGGLLSMRRRPRHRRWGGFEIGTPALPENRTAPADRPGSSALAAAERRTNRKNLIRGRNRASFPSNGAPLGEYRITSFGRLF